MASIENGNYWGFMALNEVNLEDGVVRWTVLLLSSIGYQYGAEARMTFGRLWKKQNEWCNPDVIAISGAYSKQP